MQIILSENEYIEFTHDRKELIELKDKLIRAVEINMNNDGDLFHGVRATIATISICKDKLVDILDYSSDFKKEINKINFGIK